MFQIDPASRIPIYEQLINNVIKLVSLGVLKPNDKLPPVRVLASQLGINPNTAAKAYRELESRGCIYSAVGRGSFISGNANGQTLQKQLALEAVAKAAAQAAAFGADRDELVNAIDEAIKGGIDID